jgi:hypothetical protein
MVGLPGLVSECAKLHVAGWTWAISHGFSSKVYDFYSVSPEYFGHTLVFVAEVMGMSFTPIRCNVFLGCLIGKVNSSCHYAK